MDEKNPEILPLYYYSKIARALQRKKKNMLAKNEDSSVLFFLLKFETIILVVI
jgi:hypothetical protein